MNLPIEYPYVVVETKDFRVVKTDTDRAELEIVRKDAMGNLTYQWARSFRSGELKLAWESTPGVWTDTMIIALINKQEAEYVSDI